MRLDAEILMRLAKDDDNTRLLCDVGAYEDGHVWYIGGGGGGGSGKSYLAESEAYKSLVDLVLDSLLLRC